MAATVAILGTGKMGGAMARRLHRQGFDLRLWNRTRQRAEQLGVGAVLDTPAEAASGAEVVISMLTDSPAVRQAYLGPQGALQARGDRVSAWRPIWTRDAPASWRAAMSPPCSALRTS